MKIAIVGPGRSGKDACADHLVRISDLAYTGSTSSVITPYAAAFLGISEEEAFATRHESRELWRKIGDDLRKHDAAFLARKTLEHGDICVGIRARVEMEAVIRQRLVAEVWYVHRDVPEDPTLEFGPELATHIIDNTGSLADLHRTLGRMARERGILRRSVLSPVWTD